MSPAHAPRLVRTLGLTEFYLVSPHFDAPSVKKDIDRVFKKKGKFQSALIEINKSRKSKGRPPLVITSIDIDDDGVPLDPSDWAPSTKPMTVREKKKMASTEARVQDHLADVGAITIEEVEDFLMESKEIPSPPTDPRDAPGTTKRNRYKRSVVSLKKRASRKGKKEAGRRAKHKSKRDFGTPEDPHANSSFIGLERKIRVKRDEKKRKEERKARTSRPRLAPEEKARRKEAREKREAHMRRKAEKKARRLSRRFPDSSLPESITVESGVLGTVASFATDSRVTTLAVFLLQIHRSDTVLDIALAAHQYIHASGLGLTGYLTAMTDEFVEKYGTSLLDWARSDDSSSKYEYGESSDDEKYMPKTEAGILDSLSGVTTVLSGDLITGVRNFLLSVACMKFFHKEVNAAVFSVFGYRPQMSLLDFVQHVIDALKVLARFGVRIMAGESFCDAMMSDDPVTAAVSEVERLIASSDLTYRGMEAESGRIEIGEYMRLLESNLSVLVENKRYISPRSPLKQRVEQAIIRGGVIKSEKMSELASSTRTPPFAVVLVGGSSIGKSHLVQYICKVWSKAKGRDFKPSHVYARNSSQEFWEGYSCFHTPIIHVSESAKFSSSYTKSHGDSSLEEMTSLIDTLSYYPNFAFDDKGKIPAIPEMVITDTNNASLNAQEIYSCPEAYYRRFLFIEPVVREEFRKNGSTAIDPEKSLNDPSHLLDRYDFKAYEYSPGRSKPTTLLSGKGLADFTAFLYDRCISHIRRSEHLKEQMDNLGLLFPEDRYDLKSDDDDSDDEDPWEDPIDPDWQGYDSADDEDEKFDGQYPRVFRGPVDSAQANHPYRHAVRDRRNSLPKVESGILDDEHLSVAFATVKSIASAIMYWHVSGCLDDPHLGPFNLHRVFTSYILSANYFQFFVLLLFSLMSPSGLVKKYIAKFVTRKRNEYEANARRSWNHVKHLVLGAPLVIYTEINEHLVEYATVLGFFLTVVTCFQLSKLRKRDPSPEHDSHTQGGVVAGEQPVEEKSPIGAVVHDIPSKIYKNVWTSRHDAKEKFFEIPAHTSSSLALSSLAMRNTRDVLVKVPTCDNLLTVRALGVKGNLIMLPLHCIEGSEQFSLYFPRSSVKSDSIEDMYSIHSIELSDCVEVNSDLILIPVQAQFKDIVKHFTNTPATECMGRVASDEVAITFIDDVIAGKNRDGSTTILTQHAKYVWDEHKTGYCGTPVVGRVRKGYAIYGVHFATADFPGKDGYRWSFCNIVRRDDLESAIGVYYDRKSLFPMSSESGEWDNHYSSSVGLRSLGELLPPVHKSLVNYEFLPSLTYYGRTGEPIMAKGKSMLTRSRIGDDVAYFWFETYGEVVERLHKPLMQSRMVDGNYQSPWNLTIAKMGRIKKTLNRATLLRIKRLLVNRIVSTLRERGVTELRPLTVEQAINGVEGDPFIRRMKSSTSGGYGFPGTKGDHFVVPDPENVDFRMPNDHLSSCINEHIELYLDGRCAHPIYACRLKDEPRPLEKVKKGSTRVFYMQPLDNLIVTRMYLAPFYSLMVRFGDIFGTAVGIDMASQAHELFTNLSDFSEDIIEGDYSGFDVNMPIEIGETASGIVYDVLKDFGYTTDDLKVVGGVLTDCMMPYIEILTDIFRAPGLQPSGKYATAEDNSLRGLILFMYAWAEMGYDLDEFFLKMLMYTYGDDVLGASKEPGFNAISYGAFSEKFYGMPFTTASKGEVEEKFISPIDMSFLKRHFRYDDEFKMMVAYLPSTTFVKALEWNNPNSVVTELESVLSACQSMLYEFALYDSFKFEEFRSMLIRSVSKHYKYREEDLHSRFPQFDTIRDSVLCRTFEEHDLPDGYDLDFGPSLGICTESGALGRDEGFGSTPSDSIIIRSATDTKEYELLEDEVRSNPLFLHVFNSGVPLYKALRDPMMNIPYEYSRQIQRLMDLRATLLRDPMRRMDMRVRLESGELSSGTLPPNLVVRDENFVDTMGDEKDSADAGSSYFPDVGQDNYLDLDDFFARPIEAYTYVVTVGNSSGVRLPIWDIYTSNPSVRAKLRNFAYFHATLHVRIAISGSPFHYGRLLVSYQPYSYSNATLNELVGALGTFPTMRPLLLNYLSQGNGATTMDIKANKPLDMEIPFISSKPVMRLFNSSSTVISDATSYDDAINAGDLFLFTINDVKAVSTTASPIRVQVIVWATDVQLGTNTATQIEITTESGVDERETGPVERFATSAMGVSSLLSNIPAIAPLAKASEMLFGGMKGIAALFGWSRPPVIAVPTIVKNEPYQNGSLMIGSETTKRIVLDPKQEITVDPRSTGIASDDMVIANIAARNSYLTTFSWAESDISFTSIWKCKVQPTLATWDVGISSTFVQPTACCFAVQPFAFYNVRMVYRFEIVASSFHRGKIAVVYEPNINQDVIISSDLATNKQYMVVVDIQETQTFEICVDWAHPRYWAAVSNSFLTSYGPDFTATDPLYTNGYISVFPFTSLQSNDSSDIEINVFVRGEDLRVNQFLEKSNPGERVIRTESGLLDQAVDMTCFDINPSSADMRMCSSFHFGEEPLSFRALLKRYVQTAVFDVSGIVGSYGRVRVIDRNMPINVLPYGATSKLDGVMNLFAYLSYAFLGARGGLRKRVHIVGNLSDSNTTQVKITNGGSSSGVSTGVTITSLEYARSSMNGTVTFLPATNAGFEYEVPFYSSNMFWISFADDLLGDDEPDEFTTFWNKTSTIDIDVVGALDDSKIIIETASGEDFTFLRFQGAPDRKSVV